VSMPILSTLLLTGLFFLAVLSIMPFMSVIAVNHMGRYEMVQNPRDKLNAYSASDETANDDIC